MNSLTTTEQQRYARHLTLDQVGVVGQEKLKTARVLCVGAGGLGAPLLFYLAAAGVGTLGIVDDDPVELSNLQRQILFTEAHCQQSKATAAAERLQQLNSRVNVIPYVTRLTEKNVFDIIKDYDIVADCSDNFATRYLINDACFHAKKPEVFASIFQFQGAATFFSGKQGPCYRCLFATPPAGDAIANCEEAGVLGVLPGLLGTIQATEIIKHILGIGDCLQGKLLTIDTLTWRFKQFTLQQDPQCELCVQRKPFQALTRDSIRCYTGESMKIETISARALQQALQSNDVILVDVREPHEYEICNLGGQLIPLPQLPRRLAEIDRDKTVVVHCKAGVRGEKAAQLLIEAGFPRVKNLTGGILAWIESVDPSLSSY